MATMDKNIDEVEMSSVTVLRSAAAERNKNAILEVLQEIIPEGPAFALEIASGKYSSIKVVIMFHMKAI